MNAWIRSNRARTLLAAPALALGLAACGGGESTVATTDSAAASPAAEAPEAAAAPPAATEAAPTEAAPTEAAPTEESAAAAPTEESAAAAPTEESAAAAPTEPAPTEEPAAAAPAETAGRAPIERIGADQAIANADVNIANLAAPQTNANVLDVEVLAVGDGSIQTLRDVVAGDRPVLLWFYSPH